MRSWVASLVVFVALAALHTWPLATNPAHLSRNDNADTVLNTWTLAWVVHQLPRDPRHLFDANIFYPERLTLAYSEAMIVQSAFAAPILMLGGSPVLAYNLVLIAGFAMTGWAFCLLLWRWTGSWAAGFIGGSLAAFNAHSLVQLPHLQFQHVEFIALVLFALDRVVVSSRVSDGLLLGLGVALQGLTSVYLLVFTIWMTGFAQLARIERWGRARAIKIAGLFALAAVVALLLLAPYLAGYLALHRLAGLARTADEARASAGSWVDYLLTAARVHRRWSSRFDAIARSTNFPGVIATLLAGLALLFTESRRDRRVLMCVSAAIGCALVSMLPATPFYPVLHRRVLLFQAVRVPAHLGQIVLLMVAVLSGFGAAGLAVRIPNRAARIVAASAVFVLVNVEALCAPIDYARFSSIPSVYQVLASARGAVIAEIPFYSPRAMFANAEYMLNSTQHWRPMLNGHSGFRPDSYDLTFRELETFPDEGSLVALHRRGVTHVVVHTDRIDAEHDNSLERFGSLVLVAVDGPIRIYRLR